MITYQPLESILFCAIRKWTGGRTSFSIPRTWQYPISSCQEWSNQFYTDHLNTIDLDTLITLPWDYVITSHFFNSCKYLFPKSFYICTVPKQMVFLLALGCPHLNGNHFITCIQCLYAVMLSYQSYRTLYKSSIVFMLNRYLGMLT